MAYKPQVLAVADGGTGRATLTNHGVLVGATTTAVTQLAAGSAGQVLQSGGASADPAYSTATYPSTATGTGTIIRADGTNWAATTSTYPATNAINTLLYASSANVMSELATANSATFTTSSGGVPTWVTAGTTYTPTCVGSSTAGASTYSTQAGRFVRMGPLILCSFVVIGNFGAGAVGNANISIPVASVNQANLNFYGIGFGQVNGVNQTGMYQLTNAVSVLTYFLYTGTSVAVSAGNGFNFQGSITYFAA